MKTSRMMVLWLMSALILLAGPALAGKEVTQDGVLHIMNDATVKGGVEKVALEEVWRAGGEDGEDFFGLITQVVAGEDGNIYLLDTRLSEVPVYAADGERLTTLSREGDGPGETRTPSNMLMMPDGTLGLVQVFPGKVTKIGLDGSPQGVYEVGGGTAGGFMIFFDCLSGPENLVITGEKISQVPPAGQIRTNFVASFDMEGNETARYHEQEQKWDFTGAFEYDEEKMARVDFRKTAVGQDGRVYVAAYRNEYKIDVYQADGTLERVIERPYESRKRTDEDFDMVQSAAEAQFQQLPNAKVTMSHSEPDVGGLRIDPAGNLWVTTSRSGWEMEEGTLAIFDVYSPDGHLIRQVAPQCEGDGQNDALFWTPSGDAVMVTGFTEAIRALQGGGQASTEEDVDSEAEPMEVIYFKAG